MLIHDHELFREDHQEFRQEHKDLLRLQVLLNDEVRKLTEAQKHTDDRMNALITVVDGLIRGRAQ